MKVVLIWDGEFEAFCWAENTEHVDELCGQFGPPTRVVVRKDDEVNGTEYGKAS